MATVVYNARKRGEDRASDYFKRTENVAGVKDMRFQALMPDILHWLGITKIDRMLSMSKYVHPLHGGHPQGALLVPGPSLTDQSQKMANAAVQHETRRYRRPRVSDIVAPQIYPRRTRRGLSLLGGIWSH